ncbi:MAG: hypothetical protein KDE53_40780, partial [Caldilineaceae bacterium]|nr:hypothetical protein [Caldilineaceae bacterium]
LMTKISNSDRIILHWEMALITYPLFRITVSTMGRLLRIQGEFQSSEIRNRVLEQYSNCGGIPRAVYRIIQSVNDWGLINYAEGRYRIPVVVPNVESPMLLAWLFEACVLASQRDHWGITDLLQATELFPFNLGNTGHLVLRQSDRFDILREGLDREVVLLAA